MENTIDIISYSAICGNLINRDFLSSNDVDMISNFYYDNVESTTLYLNDIKVELLMKTNHLYEINDKQIDVSGVFILPYKEEDKYYRLDIYLDYNIRNEKLYIQRKFSILIDCSYYSLLESLQYFFVSSREIIEKWLLIMLG